MENYELHNFDRKGVFYNEALTDMDNAIKELAEGGSGGGLQLEQIGTTHVSGWMGTVEGQTKVTYYKLADCLFGALIEGSGANKPMVDGYNMWLMPLDNTPNAIPIETPSKSLSIGTATITTRINSDTKVVYLPVGFSNQNKLMCFQNGDETAYSGVNDVRAFVLFIGKLADNIT